MTREKLLDADMRVYLTTSEKTLLERQAKVLGVSLSQWSRQRLLEAAQLAPELLRAMQTMRTARQLMDQCHES